MRKKLLAILTLVCFMLTMMPVMAFAAGPVAQIGENSYESLGAALEAASAQGGEVTVELLGDIAIEGDIACNTDIILAVGEHTVTVAEDTTVTVAAGKKLTITCGTGGLEIDGTIAVAGTLDVSELSYGVSGLIANRAGNLAIGATGHVILLDIWAGHTATMLDSYNTNFFAGSVNGAKVTIVDKSYALADGSWAELSEGEEGDEPEDSTPVDPCNIDEHSFGDVVDGMRECEVCGLDATAVTDLNGLAAAVNGAAAGDVLVLNAGTYEVSGAPALEIQKNITIIGMGADETTIQQQNASGTTIRIGNAATNNNAEPLEVTFANLTVDGNGTNRDGIYAKYYSTVNLYNVKAVNAAWNILADNGNFLSGSEFNNDPEKPLTINAYNVTTDTIWLNAAPRDLDSNGQYWTGMTYVNLNYEGGAFDIEAQHGIGGDNIRVNGDIFIPAVASTTFNGKTVKFAKLADAIAKAENNSTITLLDDAELDEAGTLADGAVLETGEYTLDLNGNTLTGRVFGNIDMAGGTYCVGGMTMVGPEGSGAAYVTENAVFILPDSATNGNVEGPGVGLVNGDITVVSGDIVLGESMCTMPGQVLRIEQGASFTVPAGKKLYVYSDIEVDGILNINDADMKLCANKEDGPLSGSNPAYGLIGDNVKDQGTLSLGTTGVINSVIQLEAIAVPQGYQLNETKNGDIYKYTAKQPTVIYVPDDNSNTNNNTTTGNTTTETTVSPSGTVTETTTTTDKDGTVTEVVETTTASGETTTTTTVTLENGSSVTNTDTAVDVDVNKVDSDVVVDAYHEIAADENLTMVGGSDSAVNVSASNAATGYDVNELTQPAAVTVPVSDYALDNVSDTSKLTLAKVVTNEDGTTELVYMGGSYDAESGTFTAKVDEAGDYVLVEKDDLVNIEMTINDNTVKENGIHQEMDVAPEINDENRTMLPLRYIGEALGCQIDWNGDARTITITQDDVVLVMTIDVEIPGFGAAPTIKGDRTLVPVRYISEMLGANVIWDPIERTVTIVK